MPDFVTVLGVLAVILTVAALASGLVERSPISFPLMFLGFGLAIGEGGFGFIDISPHDPILEVVATLTLSLVLLLDAVKLQIEELGKRWLVPFLILVPGTGLIIALGGRSVGVDPRLQLDNGVHRRRGPGIDRSGRSQGACSR